MPSTVRPSQLCRSFLLIALSVPLWAQSPDDNVFSLMPGDVTEAAIGSAGRSTLTVTVSPAKSAELAELTGRYLNKQVKIVVCGKLRAEPFVRERIAGPALGIHVDSTDDALATVKCLLTSAIAFDQLTRWTDAKGEIHYAERLPEPTPVPVPPVKSEPFDLNVFKPLWGSWQVTKATMNGQESRDPVLLEGKWTFEGSALTMQSPQKGTVQFKLKIDASTQPMAIYLIPVQPIQGGRGWMIFSCEGETLKLAYFDNLEGRPRTFEPRESGAKPELIVLTLSPAK